jgi:uncharacterized protein YlxW (UPF0749 family)
LCDKIQLDQMSFSVPSNGYRLEGASVRNTWRAGPDLTAAVTSLLARTADQQQQITELQAEKESLAARLAAVERLLASMVGTD